MRFSPNQTRQPTPAERQVCIRASLARRGCAVRLEEIPYVTQDQEPATRDSSYLCPRCHCSSQFHQTSGGHFQECVH